jgi:flagellar motility protein MotE (MotC chaperone)
VLSERLEAQRKELDEERAAVEKRIEVLSDEEEKFAAGLEAGSISEEQAKLVKMYASMPPDDAAALLDRMPAETVAAMLLQMRDRQAAQIMGALDKGKAAEVGKLLWAGGEDSPASQPAEPAAAP